MASTNPLILALVAPMLLGERLTWHKGMGMLLGFGGVVGVMLARTDTTSARPTEVGLAFIGVVANVASTILFNAHAARAICWPSIRSSFLRPASSWCQLPHSYTDSPR